MAIASPYCTPQEYRDAIGKDDAGSDPQVAADLLTVTRYVEHLTGRTFNQTSSITRDIMTPSQASRTLLLHADLVSTTLINVDENNDGTPETAYTTYQLLPLNAEDGPEVRPYRMIFLPSWGTRTTWPSEALVRITGVWGWAAVPEPVKRATIELTAILRLESDRASSTVTELGTIVGMSHQARGIVEGLTREYSVTAAVF